MPLSQLANILAAAEPAIASGKTEHLNIVLVMGLAVFCGTIGAKLFQKLHIPQVVGYVVVGLLAGESCLNIISYETVEALSLFNMFALGIIGFMIGGELRLDVFKKYGRQFIFILISEGIGAFILVGLFCGAAAWLLTGDLSKAVAMGLVLGAIASATAPAATVNVLWEYKTRGPLTSTILAVVALDDGLSLLLYGIASSVAVAFIGSGDRTIGYSIIRAFIEIVGAIGLGVGIGFLLHLVLNYIKDADKRLAFIVASVLLVVGIAVYANLGPILAAMSLGVSIVNLAPHRRKGTFEIMERFSPPIYALFFVLAGAHLVFEHVAGWMLVLAVVYLLGRTGGKFVGSWFGAARAGAADSVRKYLGFCLLSQAGVAIGLAIISGHLLGSELGQAIIVIVMCTTFVAEILGPMCVKFGVRKASEVGLNITEEDLIESRTVADVISSDSPVIGAGTQLSEVIRIVSDTSSYYYPVVDSDRKLAGGITLDGIRKTFNTQELNDWLVALDIAEPVIASITPQVPLSKALARARKLYLQYLPVVASDTDNTFQGLLDVEAVHRSLSAEVLSRQQKADSMHGSVST